MTENEMYRCHCNATEIEREENTDFSGTG